MEISGSAVLVTGGARGIGAAVAARLRREGARVVTGDLDGGDVRLDVASAADWALVVEEHGPFDVLVNNAGLMPVGRFTEEDEEKMRRQIEVNLVGVIHGCKAVLPGMLRSDRGVIVNIASQAGKAGFSGVVTYSATKFAVVGLTQALRDELRHSGVGVSCVLPGVVDTELSAGLPSTPIAPRVAPDLVAAAVADAVRRPGREHWVPRRGQLALPLANVLPAAAREQGLRLFGLGDPMLDAAASGERDAYEARIARSEVQA